MKRKRIPIQSVWLSFLVTAAVLGILWGGLNNVEQQLNEEQTVRLQQSIQRAAVSCYSIEGFYPAELDYLKEHYGVIIDEEKYNVFYEAMGANMVPEIKVYLRKG